MHKAAVSKNANAKLNVFCHGVDGSSNTRVDSNWSIVPLSVEGPHKMSLLVVHQAALSRAEGQPTVGVQLLTVEPKILVQEVAEIYTASTDPCVTVTTLRFYSSFLKSDIHMCIWSHVVKDSSRTGEIHC